MPKAIARTASAARRIVPAGFEREDREAGFGMEALILTADHAASLSGAYREIDCFSS